MTIPATCRTAVTALVAVAAAAETTRWWVTGPCALYLLRQAQTHARNYIDTRDDQEHRRA